ncbi:MAG TPA: GAF domain-containing protein [Plasticicumulans sp.]|nr:GAF domain-containing protein [Plasticicumulans sp.]HNB89461.1 GAF domain-containing protein [Plasticicumulans sp.]HND97479.1 GAF domain-containing protein [Plasticicumulans sp.]
MSGVDAIRDCLDGAIPAILATCSAEGEPNVAYLSQVEYVDDAHVALSYQFFNRTRQNVLAHPVARLIVTHPRTGARHRLLLHYLRTETGGALFERMKAKLAGIASHTGMSGVFRLLGSDVYRVLSIERVPGPALAAPAPRRSPLAVLRACSESLNAYTELDELLAGALAVFERELDVRHWLLLMLDEAGERLYTLASRGYGASGIGAEIALGEGLIGVAARVGTPVRIGHATAEYGYGRAIRAAAADGGLLDALETEIPLPGLADSRSQIAVPIRACGRLLGVLYAESTEDLRFGYDDEDLLVACAALLGTAMRLLQLEAHAQEGAAAPVPPAAGPAPIADAAPLTVRHYAANDSVFLDGQYLIKGVAGSILWTLLGDYVALGRTSFSNRELRVDPRIRLPGLSDNLEARLILLSRRLAEHEACVRLARTGRGRLELQVGRPLQLVEIAAAEAG